MEGAEFSPFCYHVAPALEDMNLLTSEHQLHDWRQ